MALQDGLLSFTIKETIFLSSDKAGIGELQELELVPDVEVLENESYISITGCLQLSGKYEPIRETAETNSGGTETLIEAMKFTPFQRDKAESPVYGWEERIGHRIPLNITIPVERIADVSDIYAIVDSFDYKLESPHQMLIEAELKLGGIQFADLAEAELPQAAIESAQQPKAAESQALTDNWEFAHVAGDEADAFDDPAPLEEIEQKLSKLEQERELQGRQVAGEFPDSEDLFNIPALPAHVHYEQRYGELTDRSVPETVPAEYAHDNRGADNADHQEQVEEEPPIPEADEPVVSIHDSEPRVVGFTAADNEQEDVQPTTVQGETVAANAQAGGQAQPEESWEASVSRQQEEGQETSSSQVEELVAEDVEASADLHGQQEGGASEEQAEVRVAISGKPLREEGGSLNITSIFSQANKTRQEAEAREEQSASSSSRRGAAEPVSASTLEAMHNLTSFVRNREERTSQLKLCIIQREETLEQISQRYSLPVSKLLEVNRLSSSDQLVAGQILYIPQ